MKTSNSILFLIIFSLILNASDGIKPDLSFDNLEKTGGTFFIKYEIRKGAKDNSITDKIGIIYVDTLIKKITLKEYDFNSWQLITEKVLTTNEKAFLEKFINDFHTIERGVCTHRLEGGYRLPSGAIEYVVPYSKDEWHITLAVKDNLDGLYTYNASFKHVTFNKCIGLIKNIKSRQMFNEFSKKIRSF